MSKFYFIQKIYLKIMRGLKGILILEQVFIISVSASVEEKDFLFQPIIVSAQRVPTPKNQVAEYVAVYTREDLQIFPGRDLSEILDYIPGVDVQLSGKFGQASSLSMNGSASRQVLLMVDGIPFNHQISGQANLSRIPIEHIERIEVISSASCSIWGSSLGGVVNVITREVGHSVKPEGHFGSSFAEFKTIKNSLDLAGKLAAWGYFISGSYMTNQATLPLSNVQETKFFTKWALPVKDVSRLVTTFGYSGANVRDGIRPDGFISIAPYISRYGKVLWEIDHTDFYMTLEYKYNDQDINTDLVLASSNFPIAQTDHESLYQGMSITGRLPFRQKDALVFGGDFDWHRLKSANLFVSSVKTNAQAPYANYSWRQGNWNFIPGIRFDHNKKFGSQWSPSFGMVYHFEQWRKGRWRFKISKDFNAPPVGWIFNEDTSPLVLAAPNPDLEAEKAVVYETGISGEVVKHMDMDLNFYWTDIRDAIANETISGGLIKKVNKERFRRQGVSLNVGYALSDHWRFRAGGEFKHVVDRVLDEVVRDQGIARQHFNWGIQFKGTRGLGANLFGYYNRWSSAPSQSNDRKVILDFKITQKFKDLQQNMDLELFLNVYNLTNSKYHSSPTFPLPRRYFEGGFLVKF